MALQLVTPKASFVRWQESDVIQHCIFGEIKECLPVYEEADVAFQFFLNGTAAEIDELCGAYGTPIIIGIVRECSDTNFLEEFIETPATFRISDGQMLVNWEHGLPAFDSVIGIGECFRLRARIGLLSFCSNCFVRIGDDCFTSVVEYSSEENAFGFNYCAGGVTGGDGEGGGGGAEEVCEPTIITFTNKETLSIPYTTALKDKYGDVPTVQVWIYDALGELINPLLQVNFDAYPPTQIEVDLGGTASGIVVIK